MAGGVTFGIAKETFRVVVDNGVSSDDPRVMARTNEAIQELLTALDIYTKQPLVPVGSMATYQVTVDAEGAILLPAELENALHWEVMSGDVNGSNDADRGWNPLLINPQTYVDPQLSQDATLPDLGMFPDPNNPALLRRKYLFPNASAGAVVNVTGKRQYIPLTADGDYLIIRNIAAIKLMIQAIEKRSNVDKVEAAKLYRDWAVQILSDEVRNHRMDPTFAMNRHAEWEKDLVTYPAGTLGNTRARIALEVPGMVDMGRNQLARLVNSAVYEAVQHRNFLGRSERYSLDTGPNIIQFVRATLPADVLSYSDYEVIRLLVVSQHTAPTGVEPPPDAAPSKQQALNLIERNLSAQVDAQRTAAHVAAVASNLPGSKGWMVGTLGLEMPELIVYPVKRLSQLVDRAEERGIAMGIFRGMVEEFDAKVISSNIIMPARVEAILAASFDGCPVDVRSIFFRYQKNGPSCWDFSCRGRLEDIGEVTLKDGSRRRHYRIRVIGGGSTTTTTSSGSTGGGDSGGGDTGGGGGGGSGIVDGNFQIGSDSRLVPISHGLALEIRDSSGNWIRQAEWTE